MPQNSKQRHAPLLVQTRLAMTIAAVVLWFNLFPVQAVGLTPEQEDYLGYLRALTFYEPVTGPGGLGPGSSTIGLGLARIEPVKQNSEQLTGDPALPHDIEPNQISRFSLQRGLLYPLAMGLQFGANPKNGLGNFGLHSQWTVWEALGWPCLALRLSYSQLNGDQDLRLQSLGLSPVLGYSPFSWLHVFATHQSQMEKYHINWLDKEPPQTSPWRLRVTDQSLGVRINFGYQPYHLAYAQALPQSGRRTTHYFHLSYGF